MVPFTRSHQSSGILSVSSLMVPRRIQYVHRQHCLICKALSLRRWRITRIVCGSHVQREIIPHPPHTALRWRASTLFWSPTMMNTLLTTVTSAHKLSLTFSYDLKKRPVMSFLILLRSIKYWPTPFKTMSTPPLLATPTVCLAPLRRSLSVSMKVRRSMRSVRTTLYIPFGVCTLSTELVFHTQLVSITFLIGRKQKGRTITDLYKCSLLQ